MMVLRYTIYRPGKRPIPVYGRIKRQLRSPRPTVGLWHGHDIKKMLEAAE